MTPADLFFDKNKNKNSRVYKEYSFGGGACGKGKNKGFDEKL